MVVGQVLPRLMVARGSPQGNGQLSLLRLMTFRRETFCEPAVQGCRLLIG